ncbi:uncharacterized protein LOC135198215 [Macrobrachium nipponense]|uniref:uncharacterized protein LOC135198215 n=1 Tax=Macrobrachium nipponense TaxID=159736 RepID=UPI0030C85E05
MVKAVKEELPSSNQYGCFFHLCRCVYRKVCEFGLKRRYDTDAEFSLNIRMLLALAFVPADRVVETFSALMDENIFPAEALPIVDYYEDTWIGRPGRRNTRRQTKFEIEMWSCFERIQEDLPKMNNIIEGWRHEFLGYNISTGLELE